MRLFWENLFQEAFAKLARMFAYHFSKCILMPPHASPWNQIPKGLGSWSKLDGFRFCSPSEGFSPASACAPCACACGCVGVGVCVCICTIQSISQGDSNSSPYWTLKLFRTWKPPSMIWLFNCRQALGSLHAQVMRDTCPQSIVGKQSETNRLEAEGKHDAEKGPTTAEVEKLMEWIGMIYYDILANHFIWLGWGLWKSLGTSCWPRNGSKISAKTGSNYKIMAQTSSWNNLEKCFGSKWGSFHFVYSFHGVVVVHGIPFWCSCLWHPLTSL